MSVYKADIKEFEAVPPALTVPPESKFGSNPVMVLRRLVTIDNTESIMPPKPLNNPERAAVIFPTAPVIETAPETKLTAAPVAPPRIGSTSSVTALQVEWRY